MGVLGGPKNTHFGRFGGHQKWHLDPGKVIFGHFIYFGHFPIEIPIEAEK